MPSQRELDRMVEEHMQEINKAIEQNNMEKVRRHYGAILALYE